MSGGGRFSRDGLAYGSDVYYVLRGARDDGFARRFIFDMLQFGDIAGGDGEGVRPALGLRMSDFEDALQVTAAMYVQVQWIITRNAADYRHSPLPALTPRDFIRRFISA